MTPGGDWTVQDTVSHLAYLESFAAEVIAQGVERLEREHIGDVDRPWRGKIYALPREA